MARTKPSARKSTGATAPNQRRASPSALSSSSDSDSENESNIEVSHSFKLKSEKVVTMNITSTYKAQLHLKTGSQPPGFSDMDGLFTQVVSHYINDNFQGLKTIIESKEGKENVEVDEKAMDERPCILQLKMMIVKLLNIWLNLVLMCSREILTD